MTTPQTLQQTAAEWLVRLQDRNVSLEDTLEWQHWVNADARHAAAFARIEEVWEVPWQILRGRPRVSRKTRVWAMAAAVTTLAVTGGWGFWLMSSKDLVQTEIGETRSLSLADGSRVALGGGTQLKIALGEKARQLELIRGEAFFIVAKDFARPFSVRAGGTTVTAIGTEFNVRRSGDRVVVAVIEGRVALLSAEKRQPVQLDAGRQAIVDTKGLESAQTLQDVSATTAWQSGRLVFRREPLRYVIEDVNRYSSKPIELATADLGEIRITGTVLSGSVDGWIDSVERAFGLKAVESDDRIILMKAD